MILLIHLSTFWAYVLISVDPLNFKKAHYLHFTQRVYWNLSSILSSTGHEDWSKSPAKIINIFLQVFAEVFRVLKPGGVFIVSFSNRMFYEKAISAWRDGTAYGRVQLVVQYFQCVEGYTNPEIVRKLPADSAAAQEDKSPISWLMRLLGFLSGSDPFYAVIAYKNFKPVYE